MQLHCESWAIINAQQLSPPLIIPRIKDSLDKEGHTQLIQAIRLGDTVKVRRLIEQGYDPNQTNRKGQPPLIFALLNKKIACFNTLLPFADVNQRDEQGCTPLIWSIKLINQMAFHALLACPQINLNIPDDTCYLRRSPLMHAVVKNQLEMVRVFHEKGADLTATDCDGKDVLCHAFKGLSEQSLIAQYFIDNLSVDTFQVHHLYEAIEANNCSVVDKLLQTVKHLVNEPYQNTTPLIYAIERKRIKIIEDLLKHGANPNLSCNTQTPFKKLLEDIPLAAQLFQTFLLQGANLQIKQVYDLKFATRFKQTGLISQFKHYRPRAYQDFKEYLCQKRLAHYFEIEGTTQIRGESLKLDGFKATYIWKKILAGFKDCLFDDFKETNDTIVAHLQRALAPNTTAEGLYNAFKTHRCLIINTGFRGHYVACVLYHHLFFICNRGSKRSKEQAFEVRAFDPDKLTPAIIQSLIETHYKEAKDYKRFVLQELPQLLDFKAIFYTQLLEINLNQLCPIQIVGNCAYANSEAAYLALIACFSFQASLPSLFDSLSPQLTRVQVEKAIKQTVEKMRVYFASWQAKFKEREVRRYVFRHLERLEKGLPYSKANGVLLRAISYKAYDLSLYLKQYIGKRQLDKNCVLNELKQKTVQNLTSALIQMISTIEFLSD